MMHCSQLLQVLQICFPIYSFQDLNSSVLLTWPFKTLDDFGGKLGLLFYISHSDLQVCGQRDDHSPDGSVVPPLSCVTSCFGKFIMTDVDTHDTN